MDETTASAKCWYEQGLRFECTECGACCTGAPGYVDFTPAELESMARHLDLLPDEFLRRYARRRKGWWSLREVKVGDQYDCVFLERDESTGHGRCGIYRVRPSQCRTWPFWTENLETEEAWRAAGRNCPGIDRGEGPKTFFPADKIRRLSEGT